MNDICAYKVLHWLDKTSYVLDISLVLEYSNCKFYRKFYLRGPPIEIILEEEIRRIIETF